MDKVVEVAEVGMTDPGRGGIIEGLEGAGVGIYWVAATICNFGSFRSYSFSFSRIYAIFLPYSSSTCSARYSMSLA